MTSYLRRRAIFVLTVLLIMLWQFLCPSLFARQTNVSQVEKVIRGWLAADSKPMGLKLGKTINKVDSFTDDSGGIIYYVVYLDGSGFVIVSGDDLVEPIIAFVSKGSYEPSVSNPLGALVIGDIPNRIKAARNLESSLKTDKKGRSYFNNITALEKASLKAKDKWSKFSSYESDELVLAGASSISDVWVEPFVTSTWGQTTIGSYIGGTSCYNYYTPPYSPGNSDNYPCGCVATAMAQVIRYYEHQPAGGVGWPYLGGNGSGGPYIWSNMPLQPAVGTTTETECQAIGALCYDAAESINTTYGSGGSSASIHNLQLRLEDTFGYSSCIYYDNYPSNIPASSRLTMINPNVDAGYPVVLGLSGSSGGHAIVCDGYGYNASTLYHHLNMGWSGTSDAWYNLPTVDASINFDTVDTCVYNVFISGSGEIISGRVTNLAGDPLSGVNITATGGSTHNTTTNDKGVYALTHVPSNTSFTLTASKVDWSFSVTGTSTGQSSDYSATAGNKWGVNFTGTISAGIVEFDKEIYLPGETIVITLTDSDLTGNGFQNVSVTTSGGDQETISLSESPVSSGIFADSIATAQASVVTEDGIIQVSNSETITVTYNDADDGTGNPATAQDTAKTPAILLETDFTGGLPGGWSIIDGGSSSHTWTSTNPGGRSNANWSGTFMIVDSDWAGYQDMDEQLITPNLDCSSIEGVTLKFSHYFRYYSEEIADVDVRVNSGPWQNVARYQGADTSGQVELDISTIADGQENVQIRWHYYNAYWDYYWGIDNVEITGIQTGSEPVYGGGTGIMGDPYLIYTSEQMNAIGAHTEDWGKHFKLMADIDLGAYTGESFNIIGNYLEPFTGTFDGNSHNIYNFTYSTSSEPNIGIFGYAEGPSVEIKDLTLADVEIEAGNSNFVGALFGRNLGGTVTACSSSGSVSGNNDVGGLIGYSSGIVINCYSTANVSGNDEVGGLVGMGVSISNCYSTGSVSGNGVYVGGLVGDGSATACFWDVNSSGIDTSAGGVGKTTADMMTKSTFTDAGWDFGTPVWKINDGINYPKLAWQILVAGDFAWPDGIEMNDIAAFAEEWLLEELSVDVFPDGGDGIIDFCDWAVFANAWGQSGSMSEVGEFAGEWLQYGAEYADIAPEPNGDGIVNFRDFAVIAQKWMAGF